MIKFASKYALFAAIATAVNLGTQFLTIKILWRTFLKNSTDVLTILSFNIKTKSIELFIAMAAGTATGLLIKYVLDKLYIFYHTTENLKEDISKFLIYTLMGVVTTFIFWGTEILFNHLFAADYAKYIGGAIGLTIGYITKYQLDKRFVFVKKDSK